MNQPFSSHSRCYENRQQFQFRKEVATSYWNHNITYDDTTLLRINKIHFNPKRHTSGCIFVQEWGTLDN